MKQRETLYKLFNMQPGEGQVVLLFVVYSSFMGLAVAVFYTCSTALFLANFNQAELPLAFIAGGLLVYGLGIATRKLQEVVTFARMNGYLLGFLLVSVAILLLIPSPLMSKWIYFILFLWNRVFVFVNGITFWATASRVFNFQQAKRLFSFISLGDGISSILSYFSVPVLLSFFSTEQLLMVSLASVLVCTVLMVIITRRYRQLLVTKSSANQSVTSSSEPVDQVNQEYSRLLYILSLLLVFGLVYVEYMFTNQVKHVFPNKEIMASFLGIFFGLCAVIELVIRVFLYNRLISAYSVRLGVVMLPLALLASFLITAIYGSFYGVTPLLLAFIALSRFFMSSIRRSISEPSFQVLFQPIPAVERTRLQGRIEGGPKALGNVWAGLLLWGLASLSILSMVYLSYLFLPIIGFWIYIAFRLQSSYKNIISNVVNRSYELVRSNQSQNQTSVEPVSREAEFSSNSSFQMMQQLAVSPLPADRIQAATELGSSGRYYAYVYLQPLLEDEDPAVRRAAILAAGATRKPELWPSLFANLAMADYWAEATSAVLSIGEPILPSLIRRFNQLSHSIPVQVYMIGIISDIGGPIALRFLRTHMNHPVQLIRDKVFAGLRCLGHKATVTERPQILMQLDEQIALLVWLAAARLDLNSYAKESSLIRALRHEKELIVPKVFNLLATLSGDNRFDVVGELITRKNDDIKGYLLELLDNALPSEIKSRVTPLFADIPLESKLLQSAANYPQQRLSVEDRLHDIINKDFSKITPTLKAIAIRELLNWHQTDPTAILVANAASSNELIAETSFFVLKKLNPDRFDELQQTLSLHPDSIQHRVLLSVLNGLTEKELRISQEDMVYA
ncbi:HEAT repeat domain-containing protein [Spirosoma gilvum]